MTRHTSGKKKATLIVIPSIRFTKLIIHHLRRRHMFYPRPDSSLYFPNEEHVLRYLKFSAKGTKREVFGMPIPGSLIIADIQEASYYQEYLAKEAPKSTAPKVPPRPSVSKPVTSAQPAPTSTPAKPQEKKCKQTTEISDKPSKAKKNSKYGFVGKKRTIKSVAKSVAEDAPAKEPQVAAEDADMEKALEESLKSMYDMPRGPLPPVVIREPESGKYQPLPEVLGKGKAKSDSEEESEKVVPGADAGGQGEGQAGPDPGQAGPDPGNAEADEQFMPSPMVHAGSDREHMDLDVADVSSQPSTEQMDEGFTATAYPKVQENLKLTVEEHVLLEEPASSSGTLSSLQHLSKDISFGDLFFSDKPSKADNNSHEACQEAPKSTAPKAPPRPSVSKPVTSAQPAPTSTPAKPQEKKRKQTTEISDKPSKAKKKSKYGFVGKKRTIKSVAESVAEDAPAKEPQVAAEDADMEKALEESLKSMYDMPRGPLPPVVIREPESWKYQPLPEVPGKGKAKSDSEEESEKVVPGADAGGQAGSNPNENSEGQAGLDPSNAEADEQFMPSPKVHAGSDRFTATAYPKVQENLKLTVEEHVLLEEPASSSGTLSSLQHLSKDISFGDLFFSDKPSKAGNNKANAETKVESMVTVTIEQDMSSIPLMTSSIIDLTLRPESPKHRRGHDDEAYTNLIQENKRLDERLDKHGARLYMLEQLEIPHQVSKVVSKVVTEAVDWVMQAPLRNRFRDLPEADMKETLRQRMWETESYKSHEDHMQLYEALEKSINRNHSQELAQDLAEARKKKKKSREPPKMPPESPPLPPPPPLPLSTNQDSQSKGSATPSSSKTVASAEYQVSTTTDVRLRPSISLTPAGLQMDEDMALDKQAESSDDEDIEKPAWSIPSSDVPILTNNWASALASTYSPPLEDSLLAYTGDIAIFMDWFCKRRGITELKPQDLEGPVFKIVKVFHLDVIHLQYQMEQCHKLLADSVDGPILRHNVSKPLPLGGPPGQVTIQSDFFFNKDLEYLRYGSKGSRPALFISKMKAAYYPDAGLEHMVTHMRILSIVRIEVFSMYGYDYMKKIVLRRADLNEHVIAERDFKYLYPSNFEDLYLLNLQGHLNHLSPKDKNILTIVVNQWTRHLVIRQRVEDFQLGIESYQTQLNLTKPQWDATGFEYKHDYTVIDSLKAVMFRDKYRVQMMMRFNEIHKFNDGTLQQIDEALDYRVKEFKINRMNPGLNTRFWTRKDVDRSKAFDIC
nr:hypothetical protein [Tanacetum cinerariifolium]